MKRALIRAEVVNVLCPYCNEPQPSYGDGSHMHTYSEVERIQNTEQVCAVCSSRFKVGPVPNRVLFE